MYTITEPTYTDIYKVARSMRAADRAECFAWGWEPEDALFNSVDNSVLSNVVRLEDEPLCIFGVIPGDQPGWGGVWLLGTDDLVKSHRAFVTISEALIEQLLELFPVLYHFASQNNEAHIRWLEYVGAEFFPEDGFDLGDQHFVPFKITKYENVDGFKPI